MRRAPRPAGERVVTARMWRGILLVGATMAVAALFVIDASLPGGFVPGDRDLRYAQTMAFTTLVLAQLFNVLNARSEERSAFAGLFRNRWLWGSILLALALQFLVLYAPPMQRAFGTMPLDGVDWLRALGAASMVLWVREASKLVGAWVSRRAAAA